MKQRTLGNQGLTVSAIGLGCMGMSEFYGPRDEREAIATIHRALDRGVILADEGVREAFQAYPRPELSAEDAEAVAAGLRYWRQEDRLPI